MDAGLGLFDRESRFPYDSAPYRDDKMDWVLVVRRLIVASLEGLL